MIYTLEGFMGCGKSSVAEKFAERLGCPWFDLDTSIEIGQERSIAEIFAEDGEEAFRQMEKDCLTQLIEDFSPFAGDTDIVIALGGGTPLTCAETIRNDSFCIYLRTTPEELFKNIKLTGTEHRPLLAGLDDNALEAKVKSLLEQRQDAYENCARKTVDVTGLSFDEAADAIMSVL